MNARSVMSGMPFNFAAEEAILAHEEAHAPTAPNVRAHRVGSEAELYTNWSPAIEKRLFGRAARNLAGQNTFNAALFAAQREWNLLDPFILKSLLAQESSFKPMLWNKLGFAGIAQLGMAEAHSSGLRTGASHKQTKAHRTRKEVYLKEYFDFTSDERFKPNLAIPAAARLLRRKAAALQKLVFSKYGWPEGDDFYRFVLAAYNAGEGTVAKRVHRVYRYQRPAKLRFQDLGRDMPGWRYADAIVQRAHQVKSQAARSNGQMQESEINRTSSSYNRWIQSSLNRVMGLHLPEDGNLNPQTRSAIRSFQQRHGLAVDGVVGPRTERALVASGVSEPPRTSMPAMPTATVSGSGFIKPSLACRIKDKTPLNLNDGDTISGYGGKRITLHRKAAAAWRALVAAARAQGLREPLLLPISGYRSPKDQESIWRRALKKYKSAQEAAKWAAKPGRSAHQTGRAIDLYLGGRNISANVTQLRRLPAYRWLVANASRFGFCPYWREPWHWEYNPPA